MREASCSHQREARAREDVADRRAWGEAKNAAQSARNLEKSRQQATELCEEGAPLSSQDCRCLHPCTATRMVLKQSQFP